MKVLLDTGVLGLVTHPRTEGGRECARWMRDLISADVEFIVPEVCDYELRREYVRINSTNGLKKLDELGNVLRFEKVDSDIWKAAAALWAECRNKGKPLAPDNALDGDVILVALTQKVQDGNATVVATTNVKHLEDHVDARPWDEITPL